VPEQLSLLEILEVRTVLELYIVKKTAENITEQQIEELRTSIDKMRKLMEEYAV
jgi:DNA-binding GntR family transcriptional regulator